MDIIPLLPLGISLSLATGINNFIPFLFLSIVAKTNTFGLNLSGTFLDSYLLIGVLTVIIVLDLFSSSIPIVGNIKSVTDGLLAPLSGFLVFYLSTGLQSESLVVCPLSLAGAGVSTLTKGLNLSINSGLSTSSAGLLNPLITLKDALKSFIISLLAVIAPFILLLVALITLLLFSGGIKKLFRVKT